MALTCAACHNGYTATTVTEATHVNKQINISFAAGTYTNATYSDPNGAPQNGYGNCNNSYCHSSGQSATGGTPPVYAPVTWNQASLTCSGCHGSTTANLTTGTHSKHLNGYGYLCSDCHGAGYNAATNSVVPGTHVNNAININLTAKGQGNVPTYSGDTIPQNGGFGTCNNTICHGKNSGAWGVSVSSQLCTECHGQPNVAYANFSSAIIAPGGAGVDTGGNSVATSPRVGTHQTHLLGSNNISAPMHCGECHTVHTTIADGNASELHYLHSPLQWHGGNSLRQVTVGEPASAACTTAATSPATPAS